MKKEKKEQKKKEKKTKKVARSFYILDMKFFMK